MEIKVSNGSISSIAGAASLRTEGVYSMHSKELNSKGLSKGVNIVSSTELDVTIALESGYSKDVAFKVQENIKEDIQNILGIKLTKVNVFISEL